MLKQPVFVLQVLVVDLFRGDVLAFKAHRLLYRSTLGLRVKKKKKKKKKKTWLVSSEVLSSQEEAVFF